MIRWFEVEPLRLAREIDTMRVVAPDMVWISDGGGRFEGFTPIWPYERDAPAGLDEFLAGRRLRLLVSYLEGFPMVAPEIVPLDPSPPRSRRLREKWHLNADGTLCLLFSQAAWSGREPAAELVKKASGWFIEYLLVDSADLEAMTETGPANDTTIGELLALYA